MPGLGFLFEFIVMIYNVDDRKEDLEGRKSDSDCMVYCFQCVPDDKLGTFLLLLMER